MASIFDGTKWPRWWTKHSDGDLNQKLLARVTVQDLPHQKTAADALAATTTSIGILKENRDLKILEAWFIPHDVLTADNTDYATIAVKVGATTLASVTTAITDSGDFVLNTPVPLALATSPNIDDNDVVLFTIAKAASGVIVPAGVLHLIVAER